jgi:hypothetical protein
MGRLCVRSSSLKAKEMITNQMMKQLIRQAYNSALTHRTATKESNGL